MRMRIFKETLESLIKNEGTVDGINPPNTTGILRLALDLKDARETSERYKKFLEVIPQITKR